MLFNHFTSARFSLEDTVVKNMLNKKISNIFLILFRYKGGAILLTALGGSIGIWHSLNHISVVGEEHDRHPRHLNKEILKNNFNRNAVSKESHKNRISAYLSDSSLEILVAGGNYEGLVLSHP